jgi:hypothetical protein
VARAAFVSVTAIAVAAVPSPLSPAGVVPPGQRGAQEDEAAEWDEMISVPAHRQTELAQPEPDAELQDETEAL